MDRADTMVIRAPRLLGLDYSSNVPPMLLGELQRAARACSLPLHRLEALGQDAATAQAFVRHTLLGDVTRFLSNVDWGALESKRRCRLPN